MPVQKQLIPLVLNSLDTSVDPRNCAQGKLATVENAYQKRTGEWRKRDGLTSLSTSIHGGGTISSGTQLSVYGNELLLSNSSATYTYDGALSAWVSKGAVVRTSLMTEAVASASTDMASPDVAVIGNMALFVYEGGIAGSGSHSYYTVVDLSSGERPVYNAFIDTGYQVPRVVAAGSTFYIFAWDSVNSRIAMRTVAASAPGTLSGAAAVVTGMASRPTLDVIYDSARARFVMASATGGVADVRAVSTAGAVTASLVTSATTVVAVGWLHHDLSNGSAYLACASTGAQGVSVVTVGLAGLTETTRETVDSTVTNARNVTGYFSGSTKKVWYESPGSAAYHSITRVNVAGTAPTSTTFKRSVGLGSKVFKQGSNYYVLLAYGSTYQPTYFVANESGRVVGRHLYQTGGGTTFRTGNLPSVVALDSDTFLAGTLRRTRVINPGEIATTLGVNQLQIDFSGAGVGPDRQTGGVLYMTGGCVQAYDGNEISEAGFHLYPESPTLVASNGAGVLTSSATYQYQVVWSWLDAKGRLHRSAPSVAAEVTLGASDDTVGLTIPTLRITGKSTDIRCEIYRTLANESTFYLVNTISSNVINSTSSDTIAYTDTSNDAGIQAREQIYTDGGVLDNLPPPPAKLLEVYRDLLIAAGGENRNEVWVSKPLSEGNGLAFNDSLRFTLDDEDGDITAIGSMDDKLVFFKRNSIYVVNGNGPDALGNGMFEIPMKLSTAVGTTEPRSVVRTPDGLMFKSAKGIYLLTRGLEVTYLGAPVDDFNTLTVTGAVVVDALSQVRFSTSNGETLVYDMHQSKVRGEPFWYLYSNHAAVSCALWQNQFVILSSAGVVKKEVSGQYNDDGSAIVSTWMTNWISLANLGGRVRLYEGHVIGEYRGSHTLSVYLAYNGVNSDYEVFSRAAGTLSYGTPPEEEYRFVFKPKLQQCASFRLTIQDSFSSATEGFRLTGLALLVGVKGGAQRHHTNRAMTPS